jgi:hypothetical protein
MTPKPLFCDKENDEENRHQMHHLGKMIGWVEWLFCDSESL